MLVMFTHVHMCAAVFEFKTFSIWHSAQIFWLLQEHKAELHRSRSLAATGAGGGGALGCISGVPGQAFAPCVSAALVAAEVHW